MFPSLKMMEGDIGHEDENKVGKSLRKQGRVPKVSILTQW